MTNTLLGLGQHPTKMSLEALGQMKKCSYCGKFKHRDNFYDKKTAADGKQGRCKICHNIKPLKTKAPAQLSTQTTIFVEGKICRRCKELLHRDKFGPNKGSKDGLQSWCRECFKEYDTAKKTLKQVPEESTKVEKANKLIKTQLTAGDVGNIKISNERLNILQPTSLITCTSCWQLRHTSDFPLQGKPCSYCINEKFLPTWKQLALKVWRTLRHWWS